MMKALKMKKVLVTGLCLCMMTLFSMGAVVRADTTQFTLTVNSTGYQQDNLSKRTLKAGGAAYENKCYVRPTSYTGTGTVYVQSIKLDNINIHSKNEIGLGSASVGNLRSEVYNTYAPSGSYYYLQGRFGASATGNTLGVMGNYTP